MPRGTRHVETGILRPGKWGYSLEVDGGGVWQLDVPRSARRYVGQRVTVEGVRSGFDLLDVERIASGNAHSCNRFAEPPNLPLASPYRAKRGGAAILVPWAAITLITACSFLLILMTYIESTNLQNIYLYIIYPISGWEPISLK
ncbi:DUF5818 domain-containing protein [Sphingomonas sp.]|jgi:hypothetical protein|uniref:DUF5818 domain-containing protein n=1 Tax=Sphingomonas sp. TaxID=28214 RepID=UPI002EDA7397